MYDESNDLRHALRRLPTPEPRPGFVDRALRNATRARATDAAPARPNPLRSLVTRWETWIGVAVGAAAASAVAVLLLRPVDNHVPGIALALDEARDVDVLIDSERDLEGATIRVVVTGGVALNGFDDERELQWQTDLQRGSNLLSLPLVARSAGKAQLVAVIEHEGRTRHVVVDLTVSESKVSAS